MKRISSHMRDMVNDYGATCAFVAWLGPQRRIYVSRTANIQYPNDPHIWESVHATFLKLLYTSTGIQSLALPRIPVEVCLFQGSTSNSRVVQQGWHNKTHCIHKAFAKVQSLTRLPVYISISGCKGILLKHAADLPALSVLDEFFHFHNMGKRFPPLLISPLQAPKTIKRRTLQEERFITNYSRKKAKTWDGEPLLQPGSLEWYEDMLRQVKYPPVQPLCRQEHMGHRESLSWACVDSRKHGISGESLNHMMLVRVDCPDTRERKFECNCDTYTSGFDEEGDCLHVQYLEKHYDTLKNDVFGAAGDVVRICRRDGSFVAYYYDRGFVKLDQAGWRCSRCFRDNRSCRHVSKIKHMDQESALEPITRDGGGNQVSVLDSRPGSVEWYIENHPEETRITMPMCDTIVENIQRIYHAGLDAWTHPCGRRCFEELIQLKPAKPMRQCHCQQDYQDDSGLVLDCQDALVFLNPTRYDAVHKRDIYKWVCPNRRAECEVPYLGVQDGLWRASNTMLIELQMMQDAYNSSVLKGAQSLESQCVDLSSRFTGKPVFGECGVPGTPLEKPFMDATLFRNAAIQFGKCTSWKMEFDDGKRRHTLENQMMCPCCKDCPRLLIMDGTSMSIRSKACFADSITVCDEPGKSVPKRWGKRDRSFLNVDKNRTRKARHSLAKMLKQFQKHIRKAKDAVSSLEEFWRDKGRHLRQMSALWNADTFVQWAFAKAKTWDSLEKLSSLADFIFCLASESPAVSFVTLRSCELLRECLEINSIPSGVLAQLSRESPPLFKLLLTIKRPDDSNVKLPAEWVSLLVELMARIESTNVFHHRHNLGSEVGSSLPSQEPSVLDGSYLHTGILTGLPRVRLKPQYQADLVKEDDSADGRKDSCEHAFCKPGDRTGGVFTVLCEHGFVYASFIIKEAEGRKEPFAFMTQYLKQAPKYVIYDNACNLQDHCLSRAPLFFRHTKFLVDGFHWRNHEACSLGYMIKGYEDSWLQSLNTQIAEQNNSSLKNLKSMMSRMSQKSFMTLLKSFMCHWNYQKLQRMNKEQQRRQRRNGTCSGAV